MEKILKKSRFSEDEIDLIQIIRTILSYKKFIFLFTILITFFGIIYSYTKIPIYETKAIINLGKIGSESIINPKYLEEKLRVILGVKGKKQKLTSDNSIISYVSLSSNVDEFLEISAKGLSNKSAVKKIKEVLVVIKNEEEDKINLFKKNILFNIDKLNEQISYINNIEINSMKEQILKIETREIPKIEQQINFLKDVEIKAIDNEISFGRKKLSEYEMALSDITTERINDNTQNILVVMNLVNMRNLVLDLQKRIENLKKEKRTIIDIRLKELEEKKELLLSEKLRSLQLKLKIDIKNKISNLEHKVELEKRKLTSTNIKNASFVGDIVKYDYPINIKKRFIVIVSFFTSLVFSLFLVFLFEFIKSFKEEEKKENE